MSGRGRSLVGRGGETKADSAGLATTIGERVGPGAWRDRAVKRHLGLSDPALRLLDGPAAAGLIHGRRDEPAAVRPKRPSLRDVASLAVVAGGAIVEGDEPRLPLALQLLGLALAGLGDGALVQVDAAGDLVDHLVIHVGSGHEGL